MLIAALLELKSRLMLPGEEVEELDELAPAEAAEELIERMLQYARFRAAGAHLAELHEHGQAFLYRRAPAKRCARSEVDRRAPTTRPCSAPRWAALLRMPTPIDLTHMAMPRVTVAERLCRSCATCCARGTFSFDEAVKAPTA